MPREEGSPVERRPSGSKPPPTDPLPDLTPGLVPEIELPGPAENEMSSLDEAFLSSLLESVDYRSGSRRFPKPTGTDYTLAPPEDVRDTFKSIWDRLAAEIDVDVPANEALASLADLVVYDIPDGTRSTLTVPPMMDVDLDAGMFCLALVHTLRALGARRAVLMTHTAYNRARGVQDTERFLKVMAKAIEPVAQYAKRHRVKLRLVGQAPGYELEEVIARAVQDVEGEAFEADFLVDYAEELFLTPGGREALAHLPDIDVCVRHTKLQITGGWIPTKMLKCSYVYSQNGTLFSNWGPDEYVALVAIALLSKKLMSGEALGKTYLDVDYVKKRYQLRELNLFQKTVRLRGDPKKLFVVGSPIGLYHIYY